MQEKKKDAGSINAGKEKGCRCSIAESKCRSIVFGERFGKNEKFASFRKKIRTHTPTAADDHNCRRGIDDGGWYCAR